MTDPKQTPSKWNGFPGLLGVIRAWNGLVDYIVQTRALPGNYITARQTNNGIVFDVSPELKAVADQYTFNKSAGAQANTPISTGNNSGTGSNTQNPMGSGSGSGVGLPGIDNTDPENPTLDGNPVEWHQLNVCRGNGEGGWIPMQIKIYGALY